MELLRTIHSAGCGCFCTETFFETPLPPRHLRHHLLPHHPIFNVVYDCGSSDIKEEVINEANDYFNRYGDIDLLFVSHLDEDHVNGIKGLKDFMNQNTKVILPYFEKEYRLLGIKGYFQYYYSLVAYLKEQEIPIIYLRRDNGEERINQAESIDIDNLQNEATIQSGSVLRGHHFYNEFWEYIPFNIQDSVDLNQIIQACKAHEMTDQEIEDCINHEVSNDAFSERIKNILKEVYNEVSKNYSNVTKANMSSMLLISKEADETEIIDSKVSKSWHTSPNTDSRHLTFSTNSDSLDRASCLYTGDAGLEKQQYFQIVLNYYHRFLSNGVGIMQIPHHGTAHYYPTDLHNNIHIEMGFVNITISSKNPLFYAHIPFDFAANGIPLYIVNDKPFSTIKNRVYLDW